mmetsp:Transcript_17490/g.31742  ORF Transcript_17490/g.31742 Transcript_17490/m.31742 type:complete len:90 (-) Transcript_17490:41-310(-)
MKHWSLSQSIVLLEHQQYMDQTNQEIKPLRIKQRITTFCDVRPRLQDKKRNLYPDHDERNQAVYWKSSHCLSSPTPTKPPYKTKKQPSK